MNTENLFVGALVSYKGECYKVALVEYYGEVEIDSLYNDYSVKTRASQLEAFEVDKSVLSLLGFAQNNSNSNLYVKGNLQYNLVSNELSNLNYRIRCKEVHTLQYMINLL